jgi:hypothetical protein
MLLDKKNNLLYLVSLLLLISSAAFAQAPVIKLGKNSIALNEPFTITVTVTNEDLKNYGSFPDIKGMIKANTSSSTSTSMVNGNLSFTQSITQNYIAQKEGKYSLQAFSMKINGKKLKVQGTTITVGPAREARRQQNDPFSYDPFEDWFGSQNATSKEFVEIKEDAFLGLTTSQDEVYVGEGFNTVLSLYVAESNQAEMQFYELGEQLAAILKKLRPANCWEENFNIDEIKPQTVTIDNKKYTQYKIFQASYFPLNNLPVTFPAISLKMIKYKVAKNPSFFGQNRQEDYVTFETTPKTVTVKNLPDHPLKDKVSVGNFRLEESIGKKELQTGESFNYSFKIRGEGNIASINLPDLASTTYFDFYTPNVRQSVDRNNNRITGTKSFNYYGIPKDPGEYNLGEYFQWVYFDPALAQYDTLISNVKLIVSGQRQQESYTTVDSPDGFYNLINNESNNLVSRDKDEMIRLLANIFILVLLGITIFIMIKR